MLGAILAAGFGSLMLSNPRRRRKRRNPRHRICKYCGKPVVLVPSAEERARKDRSGNSAKYYLDLFPHHAACYLAHRDKKSNPRRRNPSDDDGYTLTRRTNFPKLAYIMHLLKQAGISYAITGESFHAPILKVLQRDADRAEKILSKRMPGGKTLDDIRDDHPMFEKYARENQDTSDPDDDFTPMDNPRRRRRRRRNPTAEGMELSMFIINDGDLYRQQAQPIIKNLRKKIASGKYDATKALKLWGYLANSGAQKYTKEFGGSGNGGYGSFSPAHRRDAAHELAAAYEDELRSTNPRRRRRNPRITAAELRAMQKEARRAKKQLYAKLGNQRSPIIAITDNAPKYGTAAFRVKGGDGWYPITGADWTFEAAY